MKYVMIYEPSLDFKVLVAEVSDWFHVLYSIMEEAEITDYQHLGLKDISIKDKEELDKLILNSRKKTIAILETEYDKSRAVFGNKKMILGKPVLINLRNEVDSRLSFADELYDIFRAAIDNESTVYFFERSFLTPIESRILLIIRSIHKLTLSQLTERLKQQGEAIDNDDDFIKKKVNDLRERNYILLDDATILSTFKLCNIYI